MAYITKSLIEWYSGNKRELPWRETKNPYFIWVSEVILQQTRVNQGLKYYLNFINTFPTIYSLANADIDTLMKVWQGLGYYSRARNMHYTAKDIVKNYNGKFPDTYETLLKLKGIGQYTASAIASFAFNKPTPVLDGNVHRVISRFFGIFDTMQAKKGKMKFQKIADEIIDKKSPGIFNQAIMEFGALQCIPQNPDCELCPLKADCFAYKKGVVDKLPVKKIKIKQKNRFFNYLYLVYKGDTFIEKRLDNDIWKLLYQLPLIECNEETEANDLMNTGKWKKIFSEINYIVGPGPYEVKHVLSHQKIHAAIYKIEITDLNAFLRNNYIQVPLEKLVNYSFPVLLSNYFKDINN